MSESVCLVEMNRDAYTNQETPDAQLYLFVGMNNGILLRASVDALTGNLSDIRTRFLGARPVR